MPPEQRVFEKNLQCIFGERKTGFGNILKAASQGSDLAVFSSEVAKSWHIII